MDQALPGFAPSFPEPQTSEKDVPWYQAFASGFLLEDDVKNAWEYMSKPLFPLDETFDLKTELDQDNMWEYSDYFSGSVSRDEYSYRKEKLLEEQRRREDYMHGGWPGFFGAVAGGVVSPTMLIPLVGQEMTALRAGRIALMYSTAAGLLQEIPLQLNQEERTMFESVLSVAGQAVIGGVLGAAVGALRESGLKRMSLELAEDLKVDDMGRSLREGSVFIPRGNDAAPIPKTADDLVQTRPDFPRTEWETLFGRPDVEDFERLFGSDEITAVTKAPVDLPASVFASARRSADDVVPDAPVVVRIERDGTPRIVSGRAAVEAAAPDVRIKAEVEWVGGSETTAELSPVKLAELVNEGNRALAPPTSTLYRENPDLSAGAAESFRATKGVKKTWATRALDRAVAAVAPPIRVIEQAAMPEWAKSMRARYMQQRLSTAGVRMTQTEINDIGTVEDRAITWWGRYAKARFEADKIYQEYSFGDQASRIAGNFRGSLKSKLEGKMTRPEFNRAVSQAIWTQEADDPFVKRAAEVYEKEIFDPIFEEAKTVGVLKNVPEDVVADKGYWHRMYIPSEVRARMNDVIAVLARHYRAILDNEFNETLARVKESDASLKEFAADVARPFDEVQKLRSEFLEKLKETEAYKLPGDVEWETRLTALRERLEELRDLSKDWKPDPTSPVRDNPFRKEIEDLKKQISDMQESMPKSLESVKRMQKDIRRRLNNLNQSVGFRAGLAEKKYQKIEDLEEASLTTLGRMSRQVKKVLDNYTTFSDKEIFKEIAKLRERAAKMRVTYEKGQARLMAMQSKASTQWETIFGPPPELKDFEELFGRSPSRLEMQEALQRGRLEKLDDVAKQIEDAENFDRVEARALLQDFERYLEENARDIIQQRGARIERLRQQAEQLSPENTRSMVEGRFAAAAGKREQLAELWQAKGLANAKNALGARAGDDIVYDAPDFDEFVKEHAFETAQAMSRQTLRLPLNDIVVGLHGPEKARVLGIKTEVLARLGILELDIENVVRAYIRTMGGDIEMTRTFGDVNATAWLGDDGYIVQEYRQKLAALKNLKGKDGKPLSKEAMMKAEKQLGDHYMDLRDTLRAQIDRVRHVRGIPENPDGIAYRIGRQVMNLNVLRYMGMVMVSSFADPANIIMKNGVTRAFRDVFVPYITSYRDMQLAGREIHLAGEANEVYMHSRTASWMGVDEFVTSGTRLERGMDNLTQRMGIIAGFDFWNRELKKMAGIGTIVHLSDAMKVLMEGVGSAAEQKKALDYISSLNLSSSTVERIWKQMKSPGGGYERRGIWYPNTEHWVDKEALLAYRAAIVGEVRSTIVTPGLERPLWMDKNIGFKMVGQFKSFGFASLTKTLYAGLQEPDMALVNSVLFSLALGGLSYYTWALATGGDALEEANEFNLDKWADEMIARSGRLAVGQDVWELGQRMPFIGPNITLAGQRTNTRQGVDLSGLLLGPSFDLLEKSGMVLGGLDSPTQSTVHALRLMLPFQNLFYFRQALDQVERATTDALDIPRSR